MECLAIAVPRKKAEQVRMRLIEKNALRADLQIDSDPKMVYFPVNQHLDLGYELVTRKFRKQREVISDYRELVDVPEELRELLPSSLDIIGHVALVKLPKELSDYGKAIGKAIAQVNKPVRTVCLDSGVRGESRTRSLKILYGSRETLTVYREHGLSFKVDPRRTFFSPRLATERKTVADQVGPGERVFDLFAGVGPFSILIAKSRSPDHVYACDFNSCAYELLVENVRINKVEQRVSPLFGDVREVAADVPQVDRAIMNLPHGAFDFLDLAAEKLLANGVIHYYEVIEEDARVGRADEIERRLSTLGREVDELVVRKVKTYSPRMGYYAMDISLT